MALLSFSSGSAEAGQAITVTLDKSALKEKITDPYYEGEETWRRVFAVFLSPSGQGEHVDVTSGSGTFQVTTASERGDWTAAKITILDYDNGFHEVTDGVSSFSVDMIGPDTPTITAPTNGAIGVTFPLNVITDAYNVSGAANDTHAESDWVFKDASGNTIVAERGSATNLTSKELNTSDGFQTNTTYYGRCRHIGATFGASLWSTEVSFTTAPEFGSASFLISGTNVLSRSGDVFTDNGDLTPASITPYKTDISADGMYTVACAQGGAVEVWERGSVDTFNRMTFSAQGANYYACAINDDGTVIGLARDGGGTTGVEVYNRSGSTWSYQGIISSGGATVNMDFSPGSNSTGGILAWDNGNNKGLYAAECYVGTFSQISITGQVAEESRGCQFSPDGQYIACSNFSSPMRIYAVSGTSISLHQSIAHNHGQYCYTLGWSGDSQTIIYGSGGGTFGRITRSGSTFSAGSTLSLSCSDPNEIHFNADNTHFVMSGSNGPFIYSWDGSTPTVISNPAGVSNRGNILWTKA